MLCAGFMVRAVAEEESSVQLFGYTLTQAEPRVGADSSGTRGPWPESGRCSICSDDQGAFTREAAGLRPWSEGHRPAQQGKSSSEADRDFSSGIGSSSFCVLITLIWHYRSVSLLQKHFLWLREMKEVEQFTTYGKQSMNVSSYYCQTLSRKSRCTFNRGELWVTTFSLL